MNMSENIIKTAVVQHDCSSDKTNNLTKSISGIREAAAQGAQIVLLQELHSTEYFCVRQDIKYFDLAETIPGPTSKLLSTLAKEINIIIIASVFEKRNSGIYHNTAIVIERDGTIAGRYRKMHIPDDPGYNEKYYFTPGDLGFKPIITSLGKLGVLVCWDQWFPEAARLMALAGADILFFPTAIGWDTQDTQTTQDQQLDAWITIQRSHAIANGLPVVSCNRTGQETELTRFWGHSFICGPQGEFLMQMDENQGTAVAEINLGHTEHIRKTWPYLRDRRIDAYQALLKRADDEPAK